MNPRNPVLRLRNGARGLSRAFAAAAFALASSVSLAVLSGDVAAQSPRVKAFTGARVIDGTDRTPIDNATILVRDGKIAEIGPAGRITVPSGAERIPLAGKSVIPGIVNAHGHVGDTVGLQGNHYSAENVARDLRLYAD